ncbi:uncharacterized protein LOC123921074 [Trifolium pratense]|uniref:uncharacterized protein LOC123921074 n=1 Tax=Trifolium pratense TaxID=57577 RepID=UPI001E698173|nr:uncharacterized protein LOC123921074 [Trifolium pratense]
MVLWEITLGTAYFLGLKRTYRLALRIQRRIITSNHSQIRQFLHRRTRSVFDVAVKVHQNIQERDIEVGQNLGNFILRWLDRMKPSAQIHGGSPTIGASSSVRMTKLQAASSNFKKPSYYTLFKRGSNKRLFTPSSSIWPKPFPTIANMLRPLTPAGMTTHYRNLSYYPRDAFGSNYNAYRSGGVIRKDIQQWMLQN